MATDEPKIAPAKPVAFNSVLRALESNHGSFSRFLRCLQVRSNEGSGPRTPSCNNTKVGELFPSLLVVPPMCIAQSSRRNCRGRGRVATWSYVEVLWNLFNFLEGGCPFSETDQVRLADRASSASWTQMHAEYAGFLHDQVHQFLRLRKPGPLGRGMAQLNELVMSDVN